MELVYLWINNCKDCICQQELNFSPLYRFRVNNKENPSIIQYIDTSDNLNIMNEGKITNITAIVGSNGTGKTSLLSYIARNNCLAKQGYEKRDEYEYNKDKSIYIFFEDDKFYICHNLENELKHDCFPKNVDIFHQRSDTPKEKMLCDIRQQLIINLTNSTFIPDCFRLYSKDDSSYNVNLNLHSLYLVSTRFYNSLWGIDEYKKPNFDTKGFAKIIQLKRNEKTFQEILDILYYNFLKKNNISNFVGRFKDEISVYFDNIISLTDKIYIEDTEKFENNNGKKYFEKRKEFSEKYDVYNNEKTSRNNATNVLYLNLLFEVFYYEADFALPDIDFETDIYTQVEPVLKVYPEYRQYLKDIKMVDDILSKYKTKDNLIDNPDNCDCQYDKVITNNTIDFYEFISEIFAERKSYVLRYIRIRDLKMSAGERAMQNLFSWLVLIPQLDEIMNITRGPTTNKLLLIDEPDLYSHPEWQRKIIKQIIDTINNVESTPVQIILTSHSPIILSDFPNKNVIYLRRNNNKTLVDCNNDHKNTFGANVYSLFNDAFFMENGVVGELAKSKILSVYSEIKNSEDVYEQREYYQNFINLIGDDIIKREMKKLLNRKLERYNYD